MDSPSSNSSGKGNPKCRTTTTKKKKKNTSFQQLKRISGYLLEFKYFTLCWFCLIIQTTQLLFTSKLFESSEELELDSHHNHFIVYLDQTWCFLSPCAFPLSVNHIQSLPHTDSALPAALPLNYHPSIHSIGARPTPTG